MRSFTTLFGTRGLTLIGVRRRRREDNVACWRCALAWLQQIGVTTVPTVQAVEAQARVGDQAHAVVAVVAGVTVDNGISSCGAVVHPSPPALVEPFPVIVADHRPRTKSPPRRNVVLRQPVRNGAVISVKDLSPVRHDNQRLGHGYLMLIWRCAPLRDRRRR